MLLLFFDWGNWVMRIFIILFLTFYGFAEVRANTCVGLFGDSKELAAKDSIQFDQSISAYFQNKKVISILGSSRIKEEDPIYKLTYDISFQLGELGYSILTGGGPGVMDAANKAAFKSKTHSIGIELNSPWARHPTTFIDRLFVFDDLQIRKKLFLSVSKAWVVMPGGLGSLDEVFSIIGSVYSGQTPRKPLILVNRKFWTPLLDVIHQTLISEYKTAKATDLDFVHIVDSYKEVQDILSQ